MTHEAQGSSGLTRHDVLRVLGASAGLAYLGPLTGCGSLWEPHAFKEFSPFQECPA